MKLKHDIAWLWEEQAGSRNVPEAKNSCCIVLLRIEMKIEVLLMLYYIDKYWYHFIKEYLE